MANFMLENKEIKMKFTLGAWEEMEENVCGLYELFDSYKSSNTNRAGVETMHRTLKTAAILAKAAGETVTYEDLHEKLDPGEVFELQSAIMKTISDGLTCDHKRNGRRDLVLEELDAAEGKNA